MTISKLNSQEQPLVSIGVPTYNRPDSLRHALDCITSQTYSNLEIIVSDNASPGPETEQVINSFARRDNRIKHFRQETNIGGDNNFKFVLNEARGKYFAWFADDDACDVNYVAELVSCLESNSNVVLAMCDVFIRDECNSITRESRLTSIRVDKVENNWRAVRKLFFAYPTTNIFFCIYGLYRTQVLKECNHDFVSRWKQIVFNSEVPLLAQIAARGKIVSIPIFLKTYISHGDSMYVKEMERINRFDRWVRRVEVRATLLSFALRADLPLSERIGLFIHSLIPANPH
jgi:glycosyltransferase domain-containing protein